MTVALVLVAHVAEVADGVRRLAAQMAPDVSILAAGGDDEGGIGTSFDKVLGALEEAQDGSGVVVLYDLGSALLTAETAVEMLGEEQVRIADAPFVEGSLAAATAAQQGASLGEVLAAAQAQGGALRAGDQGQQASAPGADALTAEVTLRNPLGLHARPAADLARELTGLDATVLLAGEDRAWVDAASVVAVIGLGLRGGDKVHLAAEGADAADALRQVVALAEAGFGEASAGPADPTALSGVGASPGKAEGTAVLVVPTTKPAERAGTIDVEAQRLATAIETADEGLKAAEEVFRPIAGAHQALLNDPMLRGRAAALVGRGRSAAHAWSTAVDEAHALLSGVADPAMADRAADVLDVGARVTAALAGREFDAGLPEGRTLTDTVLVADEVLPSQVVRSHALGVRALVAGRGGASAHAAQLARELQLPAVFGVGDGVRAVAEGRRLHVDGDQGRVEIH